MKKRLTMRSKILLIAFAINLVCTIAFTITACTLQRNAFLEGVDRKLESVATVLPKLVPEGFHDKAQTPDAISPDEHMKILRKLSEYANSIDIKYLYTYVEHDGKFYVATTSATEDEIETGNETAYFTEYEQPPTEMIKAWDTGSVQYAQYSDEWGCFRSIFIPRETPGGSRYIIGADVSLDFISHELNRNILIHIFLGMAISVLVWISSYVIISHMLKPIGRLTSYIHFLSEGDFKFNEEQRAELSLMGNAYKDEVGHLASAFSTMAARLLEYLKDLKETTAAKERIESELQIAHDIQMSFLKKLFPAFPDKKEFDLHAILVPAKEVGGDLYDFYMIDDDHLFFYVGDVSDKGVPAALMMAVTITLMKRAAHEIGNNPTEILERVNEDLSAENERLLFVTLFCGILNIRTGELSYSNAGHNPPLVRMPDNKSRWLELPEGIVLGVMPGARYTTSKSELKPGEIIVVTTDGVTEAMNIDRQIYSDDRLKDTLEKTTEDDAGKITCALMKSVQEYAGLAPQSDDITILTIKMNQR